jgi:hypothetical protein
MKLFTRLLSGIFIVSLIGMTVSLVHHGHGFMNWLVWFVLSLIIGAWCEYRLGKARIN